jgi:ribosomal protein L34E
MTITLPDVPSPTTEDSARARVPFCLETFCRDLPGWARQLQAQMGHSVQAGDHTLGHLEELLLQETKPLQRTLLEEAAQKKADATPPHCPCCGRPLSRVSGGHTRAFESRFGTITVQRARGYCSRCRKWRFPADARLGLADTAGYSPAVQEMAALGVSKLPVAEAQVVIERLAGVKIPRATLDREAKRQGEQAQHHQAQMDARVQTPEGAAAVAREIQLELPLEPFTLVIMLDAWNLRERDDWGRTRAMRRKGQEPARWHWAYGATVFRLSDRAETAGGRRMILSRGYVMTRQGLDALRKRLYAEAVRRGLLQAARVLIVADGAVWIWKLAEDRFAQAHQRLDLWHAVEHLWVIARELHGAGTPEAAAWVKPLVRQLERGGAERVITKLEEVLETLPAQEATVVAREVEYFKNHRERMDYGAARKTGEPVGSGAMESTCRQYQCRFKRPGQYWSTRGDEALLTLETFWRNGRWNQLYPHVGDFDPSKN